MPVASEPHLTMKSGSDFLLQSLSEVGLMDRSEKSLDSRMWVGDSNIDRSTSQLKAAHVSGTEPTTASTHT
jgi:hypothetical protein